MSDVSQAVPSAPAATKRKRGRRILVWTLSAVGVLAVGFGVLVALAVKDETGKDDLLQAGRCVAANGFGGKLSMEVASCTDPAANYLVGTREAGADGTCPKGDYTNVHQTARIGDDFTLCLVNNWKPGECYHVVESDTERVACDAGKGEGWLKVVKVVTEPPAKAKCGAAEVSLRFAVPPTLMCVTQI